MYVDIEPGILVDNIKIVCELRGTSVYAVEKMLGYQKGTILRKWRKSKPAWDKVLHVARLLDTSVDFLVGNIDDPNFHCHASLESRK